MNVVLPSEKRKFIVGEIVNINSPSILLTVKSITDHITSSPFKVISYSNLHKFNEDTKVYTCIVLDPEFFYPKSPLFRKKYGGIYEFLRNNKFRDIYVISGTLAKRMIVSFLKDIGSRNFEVRVFPEFGFNLKVIFCRSKLEKLKSLEVGRRRLFICKNEYHSLLLYEILRKRFGDRVFVIRLDDFDYRKRVIADFVSKGEILIVPKKYRWFARKVKFDTIVFLSLPRSIEEFLFFSSVFSSGEYVFLVSDADEYKVSRKVLKDKVIVEGYINFLNFLGYKGDRVGYLRSFLSSSDVGRNNKVIDITGYERVLYNFFNEKYIEYRRGIDIILGLNDYYMYFEYGKMRGMDREYVIDALDDLVNRGILGYKYFFSDGKIVKKVY